MKKIIIFLFVFSLVSMSVMSIVAKDVSANDVDTVVDEIVQEVENEEESVAPEELEIKEPGRFSWLNRFIRNARIIFTRDVVKKSELQLKNASEDLFKAKILANENPDDPKLEEKIEKLNKKYEAGITKINARLEKLKEIEPDNENLNKFLDKYTDHQFKHQEILQRMADRAKMPEAVQQKIQVNRNKHLQKFGEVMNRLQDKEQLKARLENIIKNREVQAVRQGNRLDILERLENSSTEIKNEIQEIKQENQPLINQIRVRQQEAKVNLREFKKSAEQELQ